MMRKKMKQKKQITIKILNPAMDGQHLSQIKQMTTEVETVNKQVQGELKTRKPKKKKKILMKKRKKTQMKMKKKKKKKTVNHLKRSLIKN